MYMYRAAMEQLQKWKSKKNRKPLIIRGARQVGKTWLMKEFGSLEYEYKKLEGVSREIRPQNFHSNIYGGLQNR